MNIFTFTGRLTKDPVLKTTSQGKNYCDFSLAIETSQKKQDGTYQAAFIDCRAWEGRAQYIARTAKKGTMFSGSGEYRLDSYTGQDGQQKRFAYVLINNGLVCAPIRAEQTQAAPAAPTAPAPQYAPTPAVPLQQFTAPAAPTAPAPTADEILTGGLDNVPLPFEI